MNVLYEYCVTYENAVYPHNSLINLRQIIVVQIMISNVNKIINHNLRYT